MLRLVYLLIGYAFGCLQSAYVVGRVYGKIDIREHGSGNAGMTNVTRVMGAKAGALVGLLDVLKAISAYIVVATLFKNIDPSGICGLYAGIGAIGGHNFPFYLKFRGGKGAACMIGVILIFNYEIAIIVFGIAFVGFAITKYISVGSLMIAALFPVTLAFAGFEPETVLVAFFMMALCFYQHRSNIKRLIDGNENKFSIGKKGEKRDE